MFKEKLTDAASTILNVEESNLQLHVNLWSNIADTLDACSLMRWPRCLDDLVRIHLIRKLVDDIWSQRYRYFIFDNKEMFKLRGNKG